MIRRHIGDRLAPKISEFNAKLPKGYHIGTSGIFEESAISQASVFAVIPLMIVLMLTNMMICSRVSNSRRCVKAAGARSFNASVCGTGL
jgi:hypothetical protein